MGLKPPRLRHSFLRLLQIAQHRGRERERAPVGRDFRARTTARRRNQALPCSPRHKMREAAHADETEKNGSRGLRRIAVSRWTTAWAPSPPKLAPARDKRGLARSSDSSRAPRAAPRRHLRARAGACERIQARDAPTSGRGRSPPQRAPVRWPVPDYSEPACARASVRVPEAEPCVEPERARTDGSSRSAGDKRSSAVALSL